tara:strand:- start:39 stop:239 length:201 start_codon:yes stop_codon:yes gene_type:complete
MAIQNKSSYVVISVTSGKSVMRGPFKKLGDAEAYVDALKDDEYYDKRTKITVDLILPPEKWAASRS